MKLASRIEKLEAAAPAVGRLVIVRRFVAPGIGQTPLRLLSCAGQVFERNAGESDEQFVERAARNDAKPVVRVVELQSVG